MIHVENNQECFVRLWRKLERTRRLLGGQCKRFCIRNMLKTWFGCEATEDFIWKVCSRCEQEGWNELPLPSLYPRKHRELLRAVVSVWLGISYYKINLRALDSAYSIAFPKSTPLNVSKKPHQTSPKGEAGPHQVHSGTDPIVHSKGEAGPHQVHSGPYCALKRLND